MKYLKRPLQDWIYYGYNPIHLFSDYYLLRTCSKGHCKFSFYTIAKIHK